MGVTFDVRVVFLSSSNIIQWRKCETSSRSHGASVLCWKKDRKEEKTLNAGSSTTFAAKSNLRAHLSAARCNPFSVARSSFHFNRRVSERVVCHMPVCTMLCNGITETERGCCYAAALWNKALPRRKTLSAARTQGINLYLTRQMLSCARGSCHRLHALYTDPQSPHIRLNLVPSWVIDMRCGYCRSFKWEALFNAEIHHSLDTWFSPKKNNPPAFCFLIKYVVLRFANNLLIFVLECLN